MGSRSQRVQVTGDILLKARLEMENADKAIGQISKSFNSLEVGDKFLKGLEKIGERIGDALPDLKKKFDVDAINLGDLKGVTKDMDQLVRMLDAYESKLRSIKPKDLKVTSPELEQQRQAMAAQEILLKEFKKNTKLDLQIEGYGAGTSNIIKIKDELQKAVASGKDLQEVLRDATARSEGQVNVAKQRFAELDKEYTAIKFLEQELLLREQIRDAILATKGSAFDDTLKTQLAELEKMKPLLREDMKMAYGYKQKAAVVGDDAELQQIRDKIAGMAALQSARDKARRALEVEQAKHSDVEAFSRDNLPAIQQYEQQLTTLNNALAEAVTTAKELTETLATQKMGEIGKTADEIRGVRDGIKGVAEGTKEHGQAVDAETTSMNNSVASFRNKITQMFGLYNIYQLIRRGIQDAYRSIKELDTAMNEIAVVTTMTTDQLWGQINTYMAVAKQYGVATQGVYEVSKLYYQQGRDAVEVAQLTGETLKMAKIAGIDYAKATDNMTVALNGFKLSASDASTVVDVYSQLAARSAVDTEELAYAMSKTASIAESAGMSFENTSVFLAQMIETTREAPENIGTAMKTIIARFQEMKKDPLKILDVEGEEVSFNRVDTALQSIGMTLQDASGQFRDLDEVIYELADKWDALDRNTQRYIATTVAGSRQQSRFLALMQDSDRLVELREEAMNSEDAGLVQYAKTLDSLESKLAQLRTSLQQFYMSLINGPLIKSLIDMGTKVITFFNNIPKTVAFTMVPGLIMMVRGALRVIGTFLITSFKKSSTTMVAENRKAVLQMVKDRISGEKMAQAGEQSVRSGGRVARGMAAGAYGMSTGGAGTVSTIVGAMGGWVSVAIGALSIISTIAGLIQQSNEDMKTLEQRVQEYKDDVEKKNIARATAKSEYDELHQLEKKYKELRDTRLQSNESYESWLDLNQQIYEKYPELLSYIDEEGNAIVNLGEKYKNLLADKRGAYDTSLQELLVAQLKKNKSYVTAFSDLVPEEVIASAKPNRFGIKLLENSSQTVENIGIVSDARQEIQAAPMEIDLEPFDITLKHWTQNLKNTINDFLPDLMDKEDAQGFLEAILLSSFRALGKSKEPTQGDLLEQLVLDNIPLLFGNTRQYQETIGSDGVYTKDRARQFLEQILDDDFAPTTEDDWLDGQKELLKYLIPIVNGFEYIAGETNRLIEAMQRGAVQDWLKYYAEETPITTRGALFSEALSAQAEQTWQKAFGEAEGDEDKAIQLFNARKTTDLKTKNDDLLERMQKDPKFKSDFEQVSEYFANRAAYSANELYEFLNKSGLDKEIKDLLKDDEVENILIRDSNEVVKANAALYAGIRGDPNFEKYATGIFTNMNDAAQTAFIDQIKTLSKLASSDEDLRTSLKSTSTNEDIIGMWSTITNKAYQEQLPPEVLETIKTADVTTYSGLMSLASTIVGMDEQAGVIADRIRQMAEGHYQIGSETEALENVKNYNEAYEKANKLFDEAIGLDDRLMLMEKFGFTASDFDTQGMVRNKQQAIATYLEQEKALYDKSIEANGALSDQTIAAIKEHERLRAQLESDSTFSNLAKAVDIAGLAIKPIDSKLYQSLAADDKAAFDILTDGQYQFGGSLSEFITLLESYGAEVWGASEVIDNINATLEQSAKGTAEKLARDLQNAFDDETGILTISDDLYNALVEQDAELAYVFEEYFDRTVDGWIEKSVGAYAELMAAVLGFSSDNAIVQAIFDRGEQERLDRANKRAQKQAKEILDSFNFEEGAVKISEQLFNKLGADLQEQLAQVGAEEWALAPDTNIRSFFRSVLESLDLSDPVIQAIVAQSHTALVEFQNNYARSLQEFIMNMLTNYGDIIEQAESGSLKDKRAAEVILAGLNNPKNLRIEEGIFGTQIVNEEGMNRTLETTKDFYKINKINWAMAKKFVREEKYDIQEIYELQEELTNLQKEAAEDMLDLIDQQIAKQHQLAAAIAKTMFDPESYDFMGNSQTNKQLAPMYSLMDSAMTAYEAIQGAKEQDGEISTKAVNAMLDFIGRDTDDPTYKRIAKLATNLNPPLLMQLSNEDLDYLMGNVSTQVNEKAKEYNASAELVSGFVTHLEGSKADLQPDQVFQGFGDTIKTFQGALDHIYKTQDPEKIQKAMDAAAITFANKWDGDTRTEEDIFIAVAKELDLLPKNLEDQSRTLAESLTGIDGAMITVGSAIQSLADAITTFTEQNKPPDESDKEIPPDDTEVTGDKPRKALKGLQEGAGDVTNQLADMQSVTNDTGDSSTALSGSLDQTTDSSNQLGDAAQQAGDSIGSMGDQALDGGQKSSKAGDLAGSGAAIAARGMISAGVVAATAAGSIGSLSSAAASAASTLASIKAPNWGGGGSTSGTVGGTVVHLSKAGGGPIARKGQALVGEFGPELAFANGQYFLLGENGPEFRNLPKDTYVFDHLKTSKILGKGAKGLGSADGYSFSTGTSRYQRPTVTVDMAQWVADNASGKTKSGRGKKEKEEDAPSLAEFDRWYNYLRLIADVEYAIAELQAARENLFGVDYTRSLAKEIKLLKQQAIITERYRDAQLQYLANFEATSVKQYSEYLEVVNGVLQIHWDKLQGMEQEAADPIQKVMEEWETLTESISDSTQKLEEFTAKQRDLRNEMRQTYIDVEKQVIDGIKYQQQMVIDNLQKQLDMKVKYDNKYLEALRKSIDKERQMRERADTESERARLQRRIALLKRDTSGKSALSLAEAERQLQGLNQSAYDQRQDDFLKSEEEALLQAQKIISDELEIQTAVLQLMNDNIQLIQETVDAIMTSGPENLALFLQNWTQEYLNSSPTNQEKMSEEFEDLAGKVQGYTMYMSGTLEASIGELNLGLTELTNLIPSVITAINNAGNSGGGGSGSGPGPSGPSKPQANQLDPNYQRKPPKDEKRPSINYTATSKKSKITNLTYKAASTISQKDAQEQAERKRVKAENEFLEAQSKRPGYKPGSVMAFSGGGLADYTGPAIVHGTKRKPEAVLNPVQTGILQNLVQVLDGDFGKKIMASMMRPNSLPVTESNENSNIVIEQIVFEPGVISSDYDMKRASNVFQETLLDIAKYQGNISLRRK